MDVTYDDASHLEGHRKAMAEMPVEKTWTVPGHGASGPVRMTMRLPDVTVTDGEGRTIVITPYQSSQLGEWLSETMDFLQDIEVSNER